MYQETNYKPLSKPIRTISFELEDYFSFQDRLTESARAWCLYIHGGVVVPVDTRSVKSRDDRLCVGRFTSRTLPHYEGLVEQINKVAVDYEQNITGI